jgi:hypothetical protein
VHRFGSNRGRKLAAGARLIRGAAQLRPHGANIIEPTPFRRQLRAAMGTAAEGSNRASTVELRRVGQVLDEMEAEGLEMPRKRPPAAAVILA